MMDSMLRDFAPVAEKPKSLYVHLPFCASKCAYCDFYSFPVAGFPESFQAAYVDRLLWRIDDFCSLFSVDAFETIYVGGGTPTCLADSCFGRLVGALDSMFGAACKEWTVEANPESLSREKVDIIGKYRINRISLGIQSMDDDELTLMGRAGRAADNVRALRAVRPLVEKGVALSADLIAAYPARPEERRQGEAAYGYLTRHKRLARLKDAIVYLVGQGAKHLSLYDLTVEDGTPLRKSIDAGNLVREDEDEAYWVRKEAERELAACGLARYEVSNFAAPGAESLHNGAYWAMRSYLGVGPGGVSTVMFDPRAADGARTSAARAYSLRIEEEKDIACYVREPDAKVSVVPLDKADSAFEMVMMGLRSVRGLDKRRFEARFGLSIGDLFGDSLAKWATYFRDDDAWLSLNDAGLDILNRILVDMLKAMDKASVIFAKEQ